MTIEPFAAEIKEGRLYGRGACDTKGTGAAMLWALKQCLVDGQCANNIAILFSVDEEIGKQGARAFVANHMAQLSWHPAAVIVGEPTQLRPVVAHNGVVRWRIATQGQAAHSSNPANGRSAISMMTKVIDAIESQYIPGLTASHPLTGQAQCSINIIRGGSQINIIPDLCEIYLDRRIVPGEDPTQVLPAVEQLLNDVRRSNPGLNIIQREPDHLDWALDSVGSEAFALFVQSVLKQLGQPTDLVGVGYGTDGSNFGRAGIPTVVLGPGDIAQAHTKDEWLDLDQLQQGVAVYGQLMRTQLPGS
jgi:acetylornithine deacetylase